jgi:hypothetical protein
MSDPRVAPLSDEGHDPAEDAWQASNPSYDIETGHRDAFKDGWHARDEGHKHDIAYLIDLAERLVSRDKRIKEAEEGGDEPVYLQKCTSCGGQFPTFRAICSECEDDADDDGYRDGKKRAPNTDAASDVTPIPG